MKEKRVFSEEHKRKLSEAKKGKKTGPKPEWLKEKIRKGCIGMNKFPKKINPGWFKPGHVPENGFKKGNIPPYAGKKMPHDAVDKMAASLRGRKLSEEHKRKNIENLSKYRAAKPKSEERRSQKSREWSRQVIERDANKCTKCGANERLHAHHLVPWNENKDLRFELDNGICLCSSCHTKADQKIKKYNLQKGEEKWNAKLTEKDVLKIRKMRQIFKTPYKKIGSYFGVAQQTVSKIINKQMWRHI